MSKDEARERTRDIDRHVGECMGQLRRAQGVSQTELGDAIGVTFQQIQKYERSDNRASAGTIYAAAQALGVPIARFYEGLEDNENANAPDPLEGLLARAPGDLAAVRAFLAMPPGLRRAAGGLFKTLARMDED